MKDNSHFLLVKIIVFTGFMFSHLLLLAQDNTILAQSHYYKAEEAYNIGEYENAIKLLEKAEGYAGTNHLIQYLKVKSFYMNKDYEEAKQTLSIFFNIIDPSLKNSSQYKEMVLLVADIEEAIEEYKVLVILFHEEEERIKKDIDELKNSYLSMIVAVKNNDSTALIRITNETYFLKDALLDHVSEDYLNSEMNHEIQEFNNAVIAAHLLFDIRDWAFYKTVKIGDQTWMAENLNYNTLDSYAYDNNENNREALGLLYTWKAAMSACPDGWHLPTDQEWKKLVANLGGSRKASKAMKSTKGLPQQKSTNSSGFNSVPAGFHTSGGTFYSIGKVGYFWSSTEKNEYVAWARYLGNIFSVVGRNDYYKSLAYSCRCLQD